MSHSGSDLGVTKQCRDKVHLANLACGLNGILNVKESLAPLMQKPVNNLKTHWKKSIVWSHDGNYIIDNNISEYAIRSITFQRKTSQQFSRSKRRVEIYAICPPSSRHVNSRELLPPNLFHKIFPGDKQRQNRLCKYTPEYNRKMDFIIKNH